MEQLHTCHPVHLSLQNAHHAHRDPVLPSTSPSVCSRTDSAAGNQACLLTVVLWQCLLNALLESQGPEALGSC